MRLEVRGATTFSPLVGQKLGRLQVPSCLTWVEATEVFVLGLGFPGCEPISVEMCE